MLKRLAFCVLAASILTAAEPLEQRRARLNSLLDREWQHDLQRHPEMATHAGDYRYNDQLSDYSAAATLAEIEHARAILPDFEAIDATGFPPQEELNRALKLRALRQTIDSARFLDWEMSVTQFNGIHLNFAGMVSSLPLRNTKEYADYLARLRQSPRIFNQVIANLRQGLRDHLTPPRYLVEKVAAQAADIAKNPAPFTAPLLTFPAGVSKEDRATLSEQINAAVQQQVQPAYAKFAEFVRTEYAPSCRTEFGVWSLPDGAARYQFAIRTQTTTDLTADQIHNLGLKQVAEIEQEMLAIAKRLGYADLAAFNAHIRADRSLNAVSGSQLLDLYKKYSDQAALKLPQIFLTLPKNNLVVVPMESYRAAAGVPADYTVGAGDNSRPGRINVNESAPESRLLLNVEAIAYHEGVPGHHLQFSIAQQLEAIPPFRKFETRYNAFTEGWGLYAEQLAKELGFYQDVYSEYGRLQNEMWRAVRLVVDTGVHQKHWTRDQMVTYFRQHTAMDEPNIQTEVDRYISWPAQALSYKLGQMKFVELRKRAKQKLGDRFDIRTYHEEVLNAGPLPLDILDQKVTKWLTNAH